jgi:hypothetical protein
MLTQAFLQRNLFTYGLVLMRFYAVPSQDVASIRLSRWGTCSDHSGLGTPDTIGRKPMITATYAISGALLALTGWLFQAGSLLTAQTQTLAWT